MTAVIGCDTPRGTPLTDRFVAPDVPIDIDQFERAPEGELRVGRSPHEDDPIVEFLSYNPREAYTLREIQSNTGLPLIELAARLSHLADDGVVRHRGSYWAIDADYLEE